MINLEQKLKKLYNNCIETQNYQIERYRELTEKFIKEFSSSTSYEYFSSPGRTELGGNHTDHNGGKVIAASINLDTIACASLQENVVEIFSIGFDEKISLSLDELQPNEKEKETSTALVRGIAAGFVKNGFKIGGFKAVISGEVKVGSGLSSSASFEVLIASIFNHFYNDNLVSPVDLALIGQFAENEFFGKPCGLMDQIACACGSVVAIDFKEHDKPKIEQIDFDLEQYNYKLLVVDTGGNHQNLTADYASIPEEMKLIANYFGKKLCSEVDSEDLNKALPDLYQKYSHRAILRALHFSQENIRVDEQKTALTNKNLPEFMRLVNQSGNSSFKYLQNIYSPQEITNQPISLALAITENFINQKNEGACRIHGGGFAGTIQVFLKKDFIDEYRKIIESVFGVGSITILNFRKFGVTPLSHISF
ncbi:MAG: hypothetical protein K9J12_03640 [Melioribacteraceae bacterium]|nr:hypothetical protein [Melioribacteraceae bacterium]MCF8265223.1 hypothetical protein [Melioribacteraceae bacterium]MCF8431292.1 hypothetical protein [Melioribacteraceae bacterium]